MTDDSMTHAPTAMASAIEIETQTSTQAQTEPSTGTETRRSAGRDYPRGFSRGFGFSLVEWTVREVGMRRRVQRGWAQRRGQW